MAETGTKAKCVLLTIHQCITHGLPDAGAQRVKDARPGGGQVPQTQMIAGCFFAFLRISKLSKFSTMSIRYFYN